MNIAIITTNMGYGGAEKQVCFLANGLVERGHSVVVINMNVYGSFLREHTQAYDERVAIHTLHTHLPSPFVNIEWIAQTKRILQKTQREIVIGFTFTPNYLAEICGKLLHIPSIISERGNPFVTIPHTWSYRLRLGWINKADGGVFQTEGAKAYYAQTLQQKSIVIPNPIVRPQDIAPIQYNPNNKWIISIGRFDNNEQKRYDILLQSFARFHALHPDYKLLLYGSGPLEEQLKQWAKELSIENCIEWKGVTSSSMKMMAQTGGIFLITSDSEGISNALLEAMAVGMPVVSTDHNPGGARLLISDHENGLLAPMADVEKLSHALCEYAEHPELAEKCGKNAQEVLIRFAPEKLLNQWNEYLHTIIANKK